MAKEKTPSTRTCSYPLPKARGQSFLTMLCVLLALWAGQTSLAAQQATSDQAVRQSDAQEVENYNPAPNPDQLMEERIEKIEKTLESIRVTGEKAEDRSYFNKLMSMELIRYVRIMVVVLIVIAIVFPLTLWLLSKKRLIGLSGLSSEVIATLLLVEERQAKLANLLKEIQVELDYMQSMSAPDLKKLIEQAEKYLKQNEKDLQDTGARVRKGSID